MSTGIEWTDETWNPMTGCTQISKGCDHCYALTLARNKPAVRDAYLRQLPVKDSEANRRDPFAPRFWPDRLQKPYGWRTPKRVFVNSMSDVFHAQFSLEQIQQVFEVMNDCPQHHFQVLTKRPERALRLAGKLHFSRNIWLGTSIEDMLVAHRADSLRKIECHVRFISAEPLLGSLKFLNLDGIHWVIGGGESGPQARPCDLEWARDLRDCAARQGVAFFWKQWGGRTSKSGGRELDGETHDAYPEQLPTSNSEQTTLAIVA
jgi:protein gp37